MEKRWEKDMSNVSQSTTSHISNYVQLQKNRTLDTLSSKTLYNVISTELVKLSEDASSHSPKFKFKYLEINRILIFLNEWNELIPSLQELTQDSHKYYMNRLKELQPLELVS